MYIILSILLGSSVVLGRSDRQCQKLSINTGQIHGECCVFNRNQEMLNDEAKSTVEAHVKKALASTTTTSSPDASSDSKATEKKPHHPPKGGHQVPDVLTPDDYQMMQKNKNFTNTTKPDADTGEDVETTTVIDIGNRNAVDVPESKCPDGQGRSDDGTCSPLF